MSINDLLAVLVISLVLLDFCFPSSSMNTTPHPTLSEYVRQALVLFLVFLVFIVPSIPSHTAAIVSVFFLCFMMLRIALLSSAPRLTHHQLINLYLVVPGTLVAVVAAVAIVFPDFISERAMLLTQASLAVTWTDVWYQTLFIACLFAECAAQARFLGWGTFSVDAHPVRCALGGMLFRAICLVVFPFGAMGTTVAWAMSFILSKNSFL